MEIFMKKAIRYGILLLAAVVVCLLPGCGAEEQQQIGVNGYAYAGKTIEKDDSSGSRKFTVAGDYLYYLQGNYTIKRIALETFLASGDLSGGETVFTVGGSLFSTEDAVFSQMADIWDYAVDNEGNIYSILAAENGVFLESVDDAGRTARGMLCKQYADGEIAYRTWLPNLRIFWSEPDWLALGSGGRIYVLTAEAILEMDMEGAVRGSLPVELAVDTNDIWGKTGRLLEGGNGTVYYVADERGSISTETYLLESGESLRITSVSFLSASRLELYEGMDCILRKTTEGLYRCDAAKSSMEEILRWGDSNLLAEDVRVVAQIADDRYIVIIPAQIERDGEMTGGYERRLLTRTPVEELPERETIIVASLYPSPDLRRCAVEFNLASDTYHVSVKTYDGDTEGAAVRLDADLVSRDAPDILDFFELDVSKYAEKGMLEDLSPYLNADGVIDREDYLGNLLEGYTIKDRLVCIPKKFSAWVFWWLPQDVGGQGDWSMEDFMTLSEQYPDRRIFTGDPNLFGTGYLLREFCAPYYLERFVDWEAGTCSFDSEAFCRLLDWAAEQDRRNGLDRESLLGEHGIDFGLYEYYRVRYGEDTTVMRGYPSVNGEIFIADAKDALGILAGSGHKDGAWEFLRYFLLDPGDGNDLPVRKTLLEELMREEMESDGRNYNINRVPVKIPGLSQAHADLVMKVIESIDFTPRSGVENEIVDIVWEEAQYMFDGSRTAGEAAAFIQNRVELLLQER